MSRSVLHLADISQTTKALDDAGASGTIMQLFKAAHEEQLSNIHLARKNALCEQTEDMKPYEGKAFSALFRKVREKLGPRIKEE